MSFCSQGVSAAREEWDTPGAAGLETSRGWARKKGCWPRGIGLGRLQSPSFCCLLESRGRARCLKGLLRPPRVGVARSSHPPAPPVPRDLAQQISTREPQGPHPQHITWCRIALNTRVCVCARAHTAPDPHTHTHADVQSRAAGQSPTDRHGASCHLHDSGRNCAIRYRSILIHSALG